MPPVTSARTRRRPPKRRTRRTSGMGILRGGRIVELHTRVTLDEPALGQARQGDEDAARQRRLVPPRKLLACLGPLAGSEQAGSGGLGRVARQLGAEVVDRTAECRQNAHRGVRCAPLYL